MSSLPGADARQVSIASFRPAQSGSGGLEGYSLGMDIQGWAALQDWGSWADWFAAVGTIAAVGVALAFGLRDGRRLSLERREATEDRARFREQQLAEAEAQKRRLAAQVAVISQSFIDDLGERKCRWTVHNGGDEPISRVALVKRFTGDVGQTTRHPYVFGMWASIEAHGEREKIVAPFGEGMVGEAELHFEDGVGQLWQRKEYGALRAIEREDPDSIWKEGLVSYTARPQLRRR